MLGHVMPVAQTTSCEWLPLLSQVEGEDSGRPVPVAVMKGAPEVIRQHLKHVRGVGWWVGVVGRLDGCVCWGGGADGVSQGNE